MIQGLCAKRRALLAAVSALTWAGAAHAQQPGSTEVGEVVVTAQKRAERLEEVPISIVAVSSEQVERAGITRLEEISRIAPGVQISRTGIYTQPSIRGVSTTLSTAPENNVAIYVDGFYIPSSRGLNLDLVNIASVQVLKGPQGTLFGRNATGGAILVETLQPSLSETTGRITASYARFDDKSVQAYVSTPISDIFAVNLAGHYRKSDGYIKDVSGFDTAPLTTYSLAAKARLEASDDFSLLAKLETMRVSDGRSLSVTHTGLSLSKVFFPAVPLESGRNRTSLNHPVINDVYKHSFSLKGEYRLDGVTFTSLSNYQLERDFTYYEVDGSPAPVYDQYLNERYKTFSQEFNLTSTGDGPLQYVLGFFYFNSNFRQLDNFARAYPSTAYVKQAYVIQRTEAYAAYADATWRIADRLFLTGGIRYSHESKDLTRWEGNGAFVGTEDQAFKSTTPRAVIRYEIADDTNVYASFSKGFKSGFVNTTPPFTTVLPEKIDAYEVGFKTARGRYRFDAAAYYYDYKDLQVGAVIVVNGVNSSVTANAATAEIYGAEAQLNGRVTDNLNVSAGVAYTHARYKNFPNSLVSLPNASRTLNSGNCANPAPPPATVSCTQDWSGQRLARAPDWTLQLGLDYTIPTSFGDVVLAGNGVYTTAMPISRSDIGLNGTGYRYEQPETFLLNLRAAWTLPNKQWTFTVFGNNVTDETTYAVLTGSAFGDYKVENDPATYGVRIDYRF